MQQLVRAGNTRRRAPMIDIVAVKYHRNLGGKSCEEGDSGHRLADEKEGVGGWEMPPKADSSNNT